MKPTLSEAVPQAYDTPKLKNGVSQTIKWQIMQFFGIEIGLA